MSRISENWKINWKKVY